MKKIFLITTFISILALLVFYIFQINLLAKENYFIQSSEKKLSQLSKENETLEINFSKANSLSNIENYLQNQNFEKVTQVKYIHILESSVAANR